jgi:hypothetical protein
MIWFAITYMKADRSGSRTSLLEREDIDAAAFAAVDGCPEDEFVVGVIQADAGVVLVNAPRMEV